MVDKFYSVSVEALLEGADAQWSGTFSPDEPDAECGAGLDVGKRGVQQMRMGVSGKEDDW